MEPYKYQVLAKAQLRKHDFIHFSEVGSKDIRCGIIHNIAIGSRSTTGMYTHIYVGGAVAKTCNWYDVNSLTLYNADSEAEDLICWLNITYHMEANLGTFDEPRMETAETCVTIPMEAKIAEDILINGEDSPYLSQSVCSMGIIRSILYYLAEVQGYRYTEFCSAEVVRLDDFRKVPELIGGWEE